MSDDAGYQCGKCLRTLRRNDSYCPFCAGERMRMDTPEARKLEQMAKVCHAAVRAYAETMGEFLPEWNQLDADGKMRRIQGVKWRAENQQIPPRQVHEKWCQDMQADGWVYGPKTNSARKVHSCLVEYDELPPEQQVKDRLFGSIIDVLTQPDEITISQEDIFGLLEKLKYLAGEGDLPNDQNA